MSRTLTKSDIERATRREGIHHPVISVLETCEPAIYVVNHGYRSLTNNQEQQAYLGQHLGFLGFALEDEEFTLAPLELVSVWSKALEIWPENVYPRYCFAGLVSSAYAIQGKAHLRGFGARYIQTGKIPPNLDRTDLQHIKTRINEISDIIHELEFYVSGVRGSSLELGAELARKGDEDSMKKLGELIAHEKEHSTPVLIAIHENFSNGMYDLCYRIYDALR